MVTAANTGATAAAQAAIQATKASGVIVKVEPEEFRKLVEKAENPLVVHTTRKVLFSTKERYLTSYKGLAFFAEAGEPIHLPGDAERVEAEKIWVPS